MDPTLHLDRRRAAAILDTTDSGIAEVRLIKRFNHVWHIRTVDADYFVKAHTKDWYDAAPASGGPVRNEVSGHRILRSAGLPTADLIRYETTRDNPLGWPFVITRELPGRTLTEVLSTGDHDQATAALAAVGRHLAGMHSLSFEHPGPLIDGPPGPPDLDRWLHWLSRLERFLLYFFENLVDDDQIRLSTKDAATGLLARTLPALQQSYDPPRFVHGDCHAGTFFLTSDRGWQVAGLVDMENCSAGNPLFDFAKFMIELGGPRGSHLRWWEPLFDGYGSQPDFDVMRAILAGHAHINYTCHGKDAWPGSRDDILRRILGARTWDELLIADQ